MYVLIAIAILVILWRVFSKKEATKSSVEDVSAKVAALYKKWSEFSQNSDMSARFRNIEGWVKIDLSMSDNDAWETAVGNFEATYPEIAVKFDSDESLEPIEIQNFFRFLVQAYLANKPTTKDESQKSSSGGKTAFILGLLISAVSVKSSVDGYRAHKERLDEMGMIADSRRREKNARTDAERLAEQRHREQMEATFRLKRK